MLTDLEEKMKKAIAALRSELATIRTGRANTSLLDQVRVGYYGNEVPINQVANLSVPEPRIIQIAPWEKKMITAIEKAIMVSDLGLTPSNDGTVIRLVLPELTEERRKEFVKQSKTLGEKGRVAIRNLRRDANDETKKQVKDKKISEDESNGMQADVQKLTDRYIQEIEHVLAHKEKDILTI